MATSPASGEGGFEPYLQAVRRHPALIAAVTLTTLVAAGAWLLVRSGDYRAKAEVLVTLAPNDATSYIGLAVPRETPSDPTRAMQTSAALFDSPGAASLSARRLGGEWSAGRVRDAVTIDPVGGSNVLAIQAAADEPGQAVRVANVFVRAGLDTRRRALQAQAGSLLTRLKGQDVPPEQRVVLRAVRAGVDPAFSRLHPATHTISTQASALKILGLALLAGAILGIAASLLRDAVRR